MSAASASAVSVIRLPALGEAAEDPPEHLGLRPLTPFRPARF